MKVKELIEILIQLDQEQEVVVSDYDNGYDIARSIVNTVVKRNSPEEWHLGRYSVVNNYPLFDNSIPAYIITSE